MDSVEFLLDGPAEDLLRRDWNLLLDAGLPSQARHTAESNRPHITLVAAPGIPDTWDGALTEVAGGLPLPLTIAGLVVFRTGRGHVLARLGVVSEALIGFHRSVHHVLQDVPAVAGNCLPGRWVPHLTLARGMAPAQIAQAMELLPAVQGPMLVTGLRRWNSHEKTTTPLTSG